MKFSVLKTSLVAAACVAACGLATSAGAVTPFTNGSFENATVNPGGGFVTLATGSTAIDGWVVGPDVVTGDDSSIDYIGGYWQPEDGARSIDLSGASEGSIAQTFDTISGRSYLVNFFLAGNPDAGSGAKLTIISADGSQTQGRTFTVVSGVNTEAHMGWQPYSYNFKAATNSTTLSFGSATGTAFGPALDNVSVTAVPEPASWALMILGFGGLGAALRGKRRSAAATA